MENTMSARWQEILQYGEDRPNPQTVLENGRVRVIIAGLKAGQSIPVHPEAEAVYHFLEGQGKMTVNGKEFEVQAGSVISMQEGASRGMVTDTGLVFMAVRVE